MASFHPMRVIARRILREFVDGLQGHADRSAVKAALDAWFHEVSRAHWATAADIRRLHATASIVSAERVVLNTKGNAYCVIVSVDFKRSVVWIKWIGTHRDYDRINAREVGHGE